jgi:PKD repeat protein
VSADLSDPKKKEYIMSKRIYLASTIFILAVTVFATHIVRARRASQAQPTDQAFSMIFMSDSQLTWWRGGHDPNCNTDDCQEHQGQVTNHDLINAMLNVQHLGAWPTGLTFGANSPIIRPRGVVINGDLTAYWLKNEADLYRHYYPDGPLPPAGIALYPGLGNHDYSNNVHGPIDLEQIYDDIAHSRDIRGSIYDTIYFPDYNRSAKEAVWYMAGLAEHIPNLINKDVTGYVKVENAGGFTVRYTLEYNLPDGHKSEQSDEFTAGTSKSFVIPSRAESIHITIEENTGVLDSNFQSIWKVAGVFDSGRPRGFYYKVSGTTLNPRVEELPAQNQRPTGSQGSLAYSFDVGKYHFVQLQFRPNYEVDLPACVTLADFESPGFKVTKSYDWLKDDVAQAAAAGKYVVLNMHDFDRGDADFAADLKTAITGGNVVAIFAGHIHQHYGKITTFPVDDYDIPVFRSGSAECQKFLLAEFHDRYFNLAAVDTVGGHPAFVPADSICDTRPLNNDDPDAPDYSKNNGDPVARTYVINRKPTNLSAALNNSTAREGANLSFSASASDPDGDALTYTWDFGDGTEASGENPIHAYADNGTYAVKVTVNDGYTGTATTTFQVTVINANPQVRITSSTHNGFEGMQFTLGSDVMDPGSVDTARGFSYVWTITKDRSNTPVASGTNSTMNFIPDDDGSYQVRLTATDKDGGSGTNNLTFDIRNADPSAGITDAPATSTEGTPITLGSTVSDPGSLDTAHGFTRSWSVTKNGNVFATGTSASLSFTPDDNGSYVVLFTATDKDGGTGKDSRTINVMNVAPIVEDINISPTGAVAVNTVITASAAFTDPGRLDTHTAIWNWNVGANTPEDSNGTVTEILGSGSVTNTHTYASAGVYPVTLTVTDKDGAVTSASVEYVVVYDPREGFVIGRGWLNSPVGSLVSQPSLSGRVNFGFISRYRRRADVPKGETHFRFHVGKFKFESRQYEWLIVDGGLAQYKGTGKVNGTGGYTFLLTAADGQTVGDRVDRMRLKVWHTATGAVVYDNMMGLPTNPAPSNVQAIGGGCIVVH